MTYQVLARKWRPQDFSSIIGQQPVVTALRNAVAEDRIAQAYLFAGIRGVGKTTAARVFAKALNCEQRTAAIERGDASSFRDPCNECPPCLEITRGSALDVIEIDAATHSKVEQVRELTESLQYGPAQGRYKVVVLDEIHRLSRQAFDSLLKIVEEPPPHLVFIFATTEVETVPATILSRCQEFHFRRVPSAELTPLLRTICEAENIEANDRALRLVARAGEGSVRDSVALLDQLATFGSGTVSDEEAVRLLGGLDFSFFRSLLAAILEGSSAAVSAALCEVEAQGWDPRRVHTQFLGYCRDALHVVVGASTGQLDLPEEDATGLIVLARGAGYENLLRLVQQLLKSEELVRRSEAPALAVEIAWLKAAELPKLISIEAVLGGAKGIVASPANPGSSALPADAVTTPQPAAEADPTPQVPTESASTKGARHDGAARSTNGPTLSDDPYEAFLELVSRRKQPLAARLRETHGLRFDDGELRIPIPLGDRWMSEPLERQNNRAVIDEAVAEVWGSEARWQVLEVEPPVSPGGGGEVSGAPLPGAADPAEPPFSPERSAALDHPIVQSALDLFSGTIEAVEPLPAHGEGKE